MTSSEVLTIIKAEVQPNIRLWLVAAVTTPTALIVRLNCWFVHNYYNTRENITQTLDALHKLHHHPNRFQNWRLNFNFQHFKYTRNTFKKQKMFVHDFELTNFCSQMPIVSNQECIRVLNMFVRDLFKMK